MSIVSAMIVPSFLVLNLEKTGRAYQIASIIALFIITVPFFQAQAIFVIAYIMIALVLKAAGGLGVHASKRILLFPFLVAAFALILFACLYLTEALLGMPLNRMMLRISRDDPAIYAGVLFLKAALVCTVNLLLIRVVAARLRILRTQPTKS